MKISGIYKRKKRVEKSAQKGDFLTEKGYS